MCELAKNKDEEANRELQKLLKKEPSVLDNFPKFKRHEEDFINMKTRILRNMSKKKMVRQKYHVY
jgi:hypothetical protein